MQPPPHHLGYVVDDLPAGVGRFAATYGAGPFFAMEHIVFDEVTYDGAPAVYDHSSAFGAWGPLLVELTQVHAAEPAGLAAALVGAGRGLGHLGFLAADLGAETARLEAAGLHAFHTGRTGPAHAVWFEGPGHPIEVLQEREELLGFYAMVRAAAHDWDGADPYRVITGPPA